LSLLGEPIHAVCVWAAAYGKECGEDRIYAVSSGKPCVLLIIDPHQGTCLGRWPLTGASHSWGVITTSSGVYITGDGNLYRYVPGEGLNCLGGIIEGEHYTWRVAADEQGNVYGGCYPGGKAFQYSPETGEIRDYGVIVEDEQYVRCMKAWEGKLYIGIGTRKPYLIEMDIASGEKKQIPLPPAAEKEQLVYDLDIVYPKLVIRFTPSNTLHVYDMAQQAWVDQIEDSPGLAVSQPDEAGRIYLVRGGYLHTYHLASQELTCTNIPQTEPVADYGWIERRDSTQSGQCLLWMNRDGTYSFYHPGTGQLTTIDPEPSGQPVTIQSLTQGPDGNIYVGGYFAGGLAVYHPQTDAMKLHRQIGQIEGMLAYRGKLYMGVYPKANLFEYDPLLPWKKGSNPELKFSLRSHRQDRPFAFAAAGDRLAIGTVPDYGCLGGALTLYDPDRDHVEVFRNIADRQSIVSLAYHNEVIYAGSSIWGGLGIAPEEDEAVLTMWDKKAAAVIWQGVVVPGEKAISALAIDDDGMLWGLTAGMLFQFDSHTRQVVHTECLFPFDWNAVPHYWRGGYLQYAGNGMLVGSTLQHLFQYHVQNRTCEILDRQAFLLASDPAGGIYFARDTKLHKYGACDE